MGHVSNRKSCDVLGGKFVFWVRSEHVGFRHLGSTSRSGVKTTVGYGGCFSMLLPLFGRIFNCQTYQSLALGSTRMSGWDSLNQEVLHN